MTNILVLVDFTDTALIAIDQAIALAVKGHSKLTLFHVVESEHDTTIIDEMKPFMQRVTAAGVKGEISIGYGDLYKETLAVTKYMKPDLVVVGTHGKKGIRQYLFGSNIHRMVQLLPVPTLVVNDNTVVKQGGFERIVLPVAPHSDYLIKVEQSCQLLAEGGHMVIFAIQKPGLTLGEDIEGNIRNTKDFLDQRGIKWEYLEVESTMYSVGYSRETLALIHEQNMDLISIMARVSDENKTYGKMDKENLLLNHIGLPVLCANQ